MSFFTLRFLLQLIASFVTSIAFAIMFNTNKRHLIYIGICGLGTYAIYYTVIFFLKSAFWAAFISSVFTALFSEIIARIRRAPTVIFLLTGIIPTVPGSSLYYTMRYLILSDFDIALKKLIETLEVGLGIAGGIVTVSIIFSSIMDYIHKRKKKTQAINT